MLTFSRKDRGADPKDGPLASRPVAPQPPAGIVSPSAPRAAAPSPPAPASESSAPAKSAAELPGSRLSVGVAINLKGVEISNCDVLVIEGNVEATVDSKVMEIAKPGRLVGTAMIDVAEVHGEFSGELTARGKLVVHGTGRVTGTIHYGLLVVAEGGRVTGELKQLEPSSRPSPKPPLPGAAPGAESSPRFLLNPQPG